MRSPSGVIAVSLLLSFLHGCCCPIGGSSETPEQRAQRAAAEEAAQRAAIARAASRGVAYGNVHSLIDPAASVPVAACPDDDIEAARGGPQIFSMYIPTVDYGSLPGASPPTPAEWTWLNNTPLEHLVRVHEQPSAADDATKALAGDISHRYLAVFVSQSRSMPRVTREAGLMRPVSYERGSMRGGVYVVDLDASRVICSAPFAATNSDLLPEDADADDIAEDFQEEVEGEATDAIQEHGVHFNLNLVGIL